MSAAEALKAARAAGIHVEIDGNDLVLEAPTAPAPAILDQLSRHKGQHRRALEVGHERRGGRGLEDIVRGERAPRPT